MRNTRVCMCLAVLLWPLTAGAEDYSPVEVHVAFVELHTAPGAGYPIFDIAERGERVQVLRHYTDWYKVRTAHGALGWVSDAQLRSSIDDVKLASSPAIR